MTDQECSLDYVKTLSLQRLWDLALKYLKLAANKRKLNREYRQQSHIKDQRRKYYYTRNDIYHPTYNVGGTIEKRHKRPTTDTLADSNEQSPLAE